MRVEAWVITCVWHDRSVAVPHAEVGEPLALLPARSSRVRIEGAMVALYQVVTGSAPSRMTGALKREPPDKTAWDYHRQNAKLGHNPEIWAHRATVEHSLRRKDPRTGEGIIASYTCAKWSTREDHRELARSKSQSGADVFDSHEAAEHELKQRSRTWNRS